MALGPEAPKAVTVEIGPSDTVKYEVDKLTGHLKVDRPQKFSNVCPTLSGFPPQTLSGDQVADLAIPPPYRARTTCAGIVATVASLGY